MKLFLSSPNINASFMQSVSLIGLFFVTSISIAKFCFILSQAVPCAALGSVYIGSTVRSLEKSDGSVAGAISKIERLLYE
jgi:hypothetical protein